MSAVSFASGSSGGVGSSRTSTPPMISFASSPQYYPAAGNHQHLRRPPPPYYPPHHLSSPLSPSPSPGLHRSAAGMKYGDSHSPLGQGQNISFLSREGYGHENSFRAAANSDMDFGDSEQQYLSNRHPRRRQTIPGPIHQVLPTLPESHISDMGSSPSIYGLMGMPDPHAPAFIPSRYR